MTLKEKQLWAEAARLRAQQSVKLKCGLDLPVFTTEELLAYVETVATPVPRKRGFWTANQDIPAFKSALSETMTGHSRGVVVNLTIPAGTVFYFRVYDHSLTSVIPSHHKARAERAVVHSIAVIREAGWGTAKPKAAYSRWHGGFAYIPGTTVVPRGKFSRRPGECDSGIHFFFSAADAVLW